MYTIDFLEDFSCKLFGFQSPPGISCDTFDKYTQPECAGIDMIHIPQVDPNISITAQLGVINSQFYRFLRLSSSKFCIQVVTSLCLKDMFRVQEAPTTTLYICLYVFQA